MKRELDATLGSTVPDPRDGGEAPELATFDRAVQPFELGVELGRGGMGRVVEATDVSLARTVAIKQALSDRPDDLVRFEREVRITAQLEHPAIVPIYEAARDPQGHPYYVMRRIEGEPLLSRIGGAALPARLALLPNLLAVIDAAAFAHARQIIHRDIKPTNILLGAYGETHLIDWGLARRLDDLDVSGVHSPSADQLTQAGHVYGTVGYMAPEQARGEPVDARADVYALGATLFHVLAGRAPFAHLSDLERLSAVATDADRPPLGLLADLPRELIAIVDKAMASSREARYAHAGELAADLRAYLAGQLVGAHRYTTGQRLRRFVRRHRFAVALTTACVAAVGVVVGIAISRILDERDAAERASHEAVTAQQEANARADLLLIERASALATTDPTRAAALLLELPETTRHHARARDAIAKVAASAPERGARHHTKQTNALAFSPDASSLASVGEDGRLVTYDVATGRVDKTFELGGSLHAVDWVDPTHVVVLGEHLPGGRVIETRTGQARPLDDGEVARWWRTPHGLRYLERTHGRLVETDLHGGPSRELARGVRDAIGDGTLALFTTAEGTFVLDGDRPRRLEVPLAAAEITAFAIAPDHARVALATPTETVELELATGTVTGRWPVGSPLFLIYGPQQLVTGGMGEAISLHPSGKLTRMPIQLGAGWPRQLASGLVFASESGEELVLDRSGWHVVGHLRIGSRGLAALPDRMLIAAGSRDGTVRWFDLAARLPAPVPLDSAVEVCAADVAKVYGATSLQVVELDLATASTRMIAELGEGVMTGGCTQRVGDRIAIRSVFGLSFIDLHRGRADLVRGAGTVAIAPRSIVYALDDRVYELVDGQPEARPIYTAPARIDDVATFEGWLAVRLGPRRVLRIERATGATRAVDTPEDVLRLGFLANGDLYLVYRDRLVGWDGTSLAPLTPSFDDAIAFALRADDDFTVTLTNGSIWTVHGGAIRQRAQAGLARTSTMIGGRGLAVTHDTNSFTTYNTRTGEVLVRPYPAIRMALPLPDGRGVLVRTNTEVALFRDEVPEGYLEARRWLEHATNARNDPATGALRWQ